MVRKKIIDDTHTTPCAKLKNSRTQKIYAAGEFPVRASN
jgi:hypothetical protein